MNKKILIVEDEILIQKALKKLLEKRGAIVTATISGKDAIKLINNEYFDRIICDLMLQDITGFDVIEESKKRYSSQEIPDKFIIMTAYSSDQVLKKAASYGCRIMSKPFDDINEAINIFLSDGGK